MSPSEYQQRRISFVRTPTTSRPFVSLLPRRLPVVRGFFPLGAVSCIMESLKKHQANLQVRFAPRVAWWDGHRSAANPLSTAPRDEAAPRVLRARPLRPCAKMRKSSRFPNFAPARPLARSTSAQTTAPLGSEVRGRLMQRGGNNTHPPGGNRKLLRRRIFPHHRFDRFTKRASHAPSSPANGNFRPPYFCGLSTT